MQRTSISKKLRFEVFKRDSFTCQYCGRKSPDVLLEIDHIEPVAKDGTNNILNLLTSCKDCNAGKSDRRLNEHSVLEKQRQQLEDLQERKEQIEMMFQWQEGILQLQDDVVARLASFWSEVVPGFYLNENGLRNLKKLKNKYEIDEIMNAMRKAAEQYISFTNGCPENKSVDFAWSKIGGICRIQRLEHTNPNLKRLFYIRGILRNRLSYLDEGLVLELLQKALELSANIDSLEEHAKTAKNWTQWRVGIESFIDNQQQKGKIPNIENIEGQ